jgi:hypothetical protein
MSTENLYAPPKSEVADFTVSEAAPALWNPKAAASWSVLFSPVFGAIVHMKNWEALGEPQKAANAKAWALVGVAFFVALTIAGALLPQFKALDAAGRLLAIALLIGWYYASGKPQQAYVDAKFGNDYRKKGWLKPLSLAVLGFIGFIVVAALFGFVLGMLGFGG